MANILDRFADSLENTIAPPLLRLAANRYVVAMGNGIQVIVPFVLFGSIPLIIAFLPIPGWADFLGAFRFTLLSVNSVTFGIMSVVVVFALAYQLATRYVHLGLSPLYAGLNSLVAFFLLTRLDSTWFGAQGLLFAIVVAIISTEISRLLVQNGLYLRMPKGVPPFVTETFKAITSTMVILTIAWLINNVAGINTPQLIYDAIAPLVSALDNVITATLLSTAKGLALTIGLHPSAIVGPALPVLETFLGANNAAQIAGQALPHVLTWETTMIFASAGGAGNPFMLMVLCLRSASKHLKRVGRIALVPSIFGISEIMMFGVPITFNPILIIGCFFATIIPSFIGHALMYAGIVGRTWLATFFTTPWPLKSLVTTGGDISVFVAELVITGGLSLLAWYPFFKIYERQLVKKEAEAEVKEK
jgi:PTS system cellobiose-specific IIC component